MVSMGSPVADMIAEIDDADVATSQTSGFSWTSMRSRLHAAFSRYWSLIVLLQYYKYMSCNRPQVQW